MDDAAMPGVADLPAPDRALLRLAAAVRATGYRFVTPTPATHARVEARRPDGEAEDLAGIFGWSRPFAPELLPPGLLALMEEAGILAAAGPRLRSTVRISSLGGMLFLHSAYPTTSPDSVFFGPDTYRFARAVRAALARRAGPVRRAVDIGAGAGPGGILVAAASPAAEVLLVDINDAALRLARVNALLAGLPGAEPRRSDLLSDVAGEFDLVVSNPPYLNDPLERAYRHGGGPLGAALSLRILEAGLDRLASGGTLLLYTGVAIVNGGDPFLAEATERLRGRRVGWTYEEVDPDVFGEELETAAYRGADRIAAVVLEATRSDGPDAGRDGSPG